MPTPEWDALQAAQRAAQDVYDAAVEPAAADLRAATFAADVVRNALVAAADQDRAAYLAPYVAAVQAAMDQAQPEYDAAVAVPLAAYKTAAAAAVQP